MVLNKWRTKQFKTSFGKFPASLSYITNKRIIYFKAGFYHPTVLTRAISSLVWLINLIQMSKTDLFIIDGSSVS